MSRAARLYQLQELDLREEEGRRRLKEINAALGESAALLQARQALQKAQEETKKWSIRQRDLELEIQGIKRDIASSERQLYGGGIRNPKELSDLQAKVESLRRFLAKREEELLEAMIGREEAEAAQAEARRKLERVEAAWREEQASLQQEKAELERELAEIDQNREELLPQIRPDDLETYQALRRTKGGRAVALMRRGACTTCGMEVPQGRVERGRERGLLFCGNCERILVMET